MTVADFGSLWKFISGPAAAWLLSYLVHSTLILGLAWGIARFSRVSRPVRDVLWKAALVGGVFTATVQVLAGGGGLAGGWTVGGAAPATSVPALIATSVSPSVPSDGPSPLHAFLEGVRTGAARGWPQLLLGAWVLGAALCVARLLIARRRLGRQLPRREIATGPVRNLLDHLCRSAGIPPGVRLTVSPRIGSPVVLGRREICLPERALTDLDREQQYTVLAHELAHVVRRDPAWRWLSAAVQGVFFLQPLNRVARRRLLDNAEFLADDWTVTRTGEGMTLARCLLEVAVWTRPFPAALEAAGMAERGTPIVRRVERLLSTTTSRGASGRRTVLGAVALLAAVAAVSPGFMPYPPPSVVNSMIPPAAAAAAEVPPPSRSPATVPEPFFRFRPEPGAKAAAPVERRGISRDDTRIPAPQPRAVPRPDRFQWVPVAPRPAERTRAIRQVFLLQVRPAVMDVQVLKIQELQRSLQMMRLNLDDLRIDADARSLLIEARKTLDAREDRLRRTEDLLRQLLEEPAGPPVSVFWI
jgi:beta-lactamase regulating signal transducer with metallopeptidase domain